MKNPYHDENESPRLLLASIAAFAMPKTGFALFTNQ